MDEDDSGMTQHSHFTTAPVSTVNFSFSMLLAHFVFSNPAAADADSKAFIILTTWKR